MRYSHTLYARVSQATLKKNNFIYFTFGCAGSSLLHGLSLVAASRSSSLVVVCGLLIMVASLVAEGVL